MKKVLFLVNPLSGRLVGKKLKKRIISELHGLLAKDQYDIEFTEADIVKQLKDVSPGYETVVVAGGDGTISQAVQGIASLENKPKAGLIPIGIGNDLALSLGILRIFKSQGLKALLEVILGGKTRHVDIIGLDDKVSFINYFGIGIDAKISNDFNRLRSKPLFRSIFSSFFNKPFYGVLSLKNIFYRIPFDIELRYSSGQSRDALLTVPGGTSEVLVTNIKTYASGAMLSSKSRTDDGKFEITVISSMWQWLIMHLTRILNRPLNTVCPSLIQFQTDRLEIKFSGNTFYQIDGEIFNDFTEEKKHLLMSIKSNVEIIVP